MIPNSKLKYLPAVLSGILALLILFGWQFHINFFKNAFKGDAAVSPLSAICFLIASLGFLYKTTSRIPAGALLVIIAGWKIFSWINGSAFPPEFWFYTDQIGSGRMSLNTAFNLLLIGFALLYLQKIFIQYIGLILFFVALLNLTGYLYGIRPFYELKDSSPLPFYSAFCFLLLSVQLLAIHRRKGFMREFSGKLAGAVMAKKILPITFGTGILIGTVLHFFLQSSNRADIQIASLVFFLIAASLFTTWYLAVMLNRKDIADRNAVNTLRKTDQKQIADYKYALDESAIVAITNQKGIIEYVNENFCRISGYTSKELIGQDHRLVNSQFHSPEFMKDLWRTIASGNVWRGEIKNKSKSGSYYWVDTTIVPFLNEKGKPYRYTAIRFDITERKSTEAELHAAEAEKQIVQANLKTIFDTTDIAFVLISPAGEVVSFNTKAAGFCMEQFNKELVVGGSAVYYFTKGRQNFIERVMDRAIKGTNTKFEVRYPQTNGTDRWFSVKWAGVNGNEEQCVGLLLSIWDITESKTIELQKNKITSDLLQRNKDLEQFTYIVSHNLRAPAANITALSSMLSGSDQQDAPILEALQKSSGVLDEIIRDLNNTLQITHHVDEKKEQVSIRQIAEQVKHSLSDLMRHNQVKLELRLDADAETVISIRAYLYSVFYNLIQNSVKYRSETSAPEIIITAHRRNEHLVISLQDNGRGIDLKKYGDQVFGLYKRFDFSAEGKGLGLFMVKNQVQALGGKISVKSKLGSGTEFLISLPVEMQEIPAQA